MVLLCSRHHTVIHDGHYRLSLDPETRALTVHTPTDDAVPHRPDQPWHPAAELDPHNTIKPGTLPPHAIDTLDLHYAVMVLMQFAA